jgi:hypothetical protein
MPRDPSGNYTLPALGNPAVTNTPITIAWWNGTSTDMAAAFTDSLSRSGQGGMLGPFGAVDGTAGAPGLTFASETNLGFYRPAPGEMDVTVGGTRFSRWTSAGLQGTFDNGSTWKDPLYNNHGDQTFTGGLDFSVGKLSIAGKAVQSKFTAATTSTGSFSTPSTTYTAVTNANISFTATGGPVLVQVLPDGTANPAMFFTNPTTGTLSPTVASMAIALSADVGSTFFAPQQIDAVSVYSGILYWHSSIPTSIYSTWYSPAAGAATLGLYVKAINGPAGSSSNANVSNCKLCIIQFF